MDLGLEGQERRSSRAPPRASAAPSSSCWPAKGVDIGFCARTEDEVAGDAPVPFRPRASRPSARPSMSATARLTRLARTYGDRRSAGATSSCPDVSAGGGMDSEKNWWKNFEIDVLHTVRGCEALMEHLKKSGQGSVVIISSTNAHRDFRRADGIQRHEGGADHLLETALAVRRPAECARECRVAGTDLLRGRRLGDDQGHQSEVLRLDVAGHSVRVAWAPRKRSHASWRSSRARPSSLITGANVVADNGFTKGVRF